MRGTLAILCKGLTESDALSGSSRVDRSEGDRLPWDRDRFEESLSLPLLLFDLLSILLEIVSPMMIMLIKEVFIHKAALSQIPSPSGPFDQRTRCAV